MVLFLPSPRSTSLFCVSRLPAAHHVCHLIPRAFALPQAVVCQHNDVCITVIVCVLGHSEKRSQVLGTQGAQHGSPRLANHSCGSRTFHTHGHQRRPCENRCSFLPACHKRKGLRGCCCYRCVPVSRVRHPVQFHCRRSLHRGCACVSLREMQVPPNLLGAVRLVPENSSVFVP